MTIKMRKFHLPIVILLLIFTPTICLADAIYDFYQTSDGALLATMYLSGDGPQYDYTQADFTLRNAGKALFGYGIEFDIYSGGLLEEDGQDGLTFTDEGTVFVDTTFEPWDQAIFGAWFTPIGEELGDAGSSSEGFSVEGDWVRIADGHYDFMQEGTGALLATMYLSGDGPQYDYTQADFTLRNAGKALFGYGIEFDIYSGGLLEEDGQDGLTFTDEGTVFVDTTFEPWDQAIFGAWFTPIGEELGDAGSSSEGFSVEGDWVKRNATDVPIPEPATMLLLGSGLIGLAGFRRKNKK